MPHCTLHPPLFVIQVITAVDPRYFRPTEVETLLGDPSDAEQRLGWKPKTTFKVCTGLPCTRVSAVWLCAELDLSPSCHVLLCVWPMCGALAGEYGDVFLADALCACSRCAPLGSREQGAVAHVLNLAVAPLPRTPFHIQPYTRVQRAAISCLSSAVRAPQLTTPRPLCPAVPHGQSRTTKASPYSSSG